MSLQDRVNELLKLSQMVNLSNPSTINELSSLMNKLQRVNAIEKSANMSVLQSDIPRIVYNLANSVSQASLAAVNTQTAQSYSDSLRKLSQFIPPGVISPQYIASLTSARGILRDKIQALTAKTAGKTVQTQLLNSMMLSQSNSMKPQIDQLPVKLSLPPPPNEGNGLQAQVSDIQNVLAISPASGMIANSSLTPTMKILSQYAQSIGYQGTGTISGMRSSAYVGVDINYDDDIPVYKPFPMSKEKFSSQTASIQQTFRQYAGKTINAWNNYVAAEEQFVNFTSKVNSKDKRQQYVKSQIKSMNDDTFRAQVFATLTYYYIAIPLKTMIAKSKKEIYQMNQATKSNLFTKSWFLNKYQISPGVSFNPLYLSYQNIKSLIIFLLSLQSIQISNQITESVLIQKVDDDTTIKKMWEAFVLWLPDKSVIPMGNNKIKEVISYPTNKRYQSSAYLKSMKIQDSVITQISSREGAVGIKRYAINIPNIYANSEVLALINEAIKSDDDDDPLQDGHWKISWGSPDMPAFDYIWGKMLS